MASRRLQIWSWKWALLISRKSETNGIVNNFFNANITLKGLTNVCPIAEKGGQFPRHTYLQKVYDLVLVEFVQPLIKYYTEQSQWPIAGASAAAAAGNTTAGKKLVPKQQQQQQQQCIICWPVMSSTPIIRHLPSPPDWAITSTLRC